MAYIWLFVVPPLNQRTEKLLLIENGEPLKLLSEVENNGQKSRCQKYMVANARRVSFVVLPQKQSFGWLHHWSKV